MIERYLGYSNIAVDSISDKCWKRGILFGIFLPVLVGIGVLISYFTASTKLSEVDIVLPIGLGLILGTILIGCCLCCSQDCIRDAPHDKVDMWNFRNKKNFGIELEMNEEYYEYKTCDHRLCSKHGKTKEEEGEYNAVLQVKIDHETYGKYLANKTSPNV